MRGALLIGIDHYVDNPLGGCVNDARALRALLARNANDSRNFECVELTSAEVGPPITSHGLESAVTGLLNSESDTAFIHFSGHGTVEAQGASAVVAQDGGTLRLTDIIAMMAESKIRQRVLTLDCCFAGGVGAEQFLSANVSVLPEGVAVLAAARATESASEEAGSGAFSTYLCAGLDGGAADVVGRVTVAGLYAYLDEAFGVLDQRPVMKANLTRLVDLRTCEPLVPIETLRRLPEFFPDPASNFSLDPEFEDTVEEHDPDKVAVFKELQKCAAAQLVVPVDEKHMYFAAMNSKSCRLTALGQRYWRLAREDRL